VTGGFVFEHPRPYRGDEIQARRPMALDCIHEFVRIRPGHEVHRLAQLERAHRQRPSRHVEQRKHTHRRPRMIVDRARDTAEVVRAVRQDHPLRAAGAPTGEEDDVRVAFVERRLRRPLDGSVVGVAIQVSMVHHPGIPPCRHRRVCGVGDHQTRTRVPGNGLRFSGAVQRVQWREHRADLRDRREDRQRLE
jgi:hypothetical protein